MNAVFMGYRSVVKEGGGDAGLCSSWVRERWRRGGRCYGLLGVEAGGF